MRITSLLAPDWQHRDLRLSFGTVNLILGDTFSGKSAIIRAIQTGMYGRPLGLNNSNAAVFQCSSNPNDLMVRLEFSDGKANTLNIRRTKDGFTSERNFDYEFPEVLMSAMEYLTLSGKERLEYVLERSRTTLLSKPAIYARLKNDDDKAKPCIAKWNAFIDSRTNSKYSPFTDLKSITDALAKRLSELKKQAKTLEAQIAGFKAPAVTEDVTAKCEAARVVMEERLAVVTRLEAKGETEEASELRDNIRNWTRELANEQEDRESLTRQINALKNAKKCACGGACPCHANKGLDTDLKACENEIRIISAKLEKAKKRLKVIESKGPSAAEKKATEDLNKARKEFNDLMAKLVDFQAAKRTEAGIQKTKDSLKDSLDEITIVKDLQERALKYQQEVVEHTFNSLLKKSKAFTDDILKSPLQYRDGELGRMDGDIWVSHEVFSGCEKLVAYIGLQIALAQESPIKLVVLDDPFSGAQPKIKFDIYQRMQQLIALGVVDQVFMLDTSDRDWKVTSNTNVIRV